MIPPRILISARNDQFPRLSLGVAVDGAELTAPVSKGYTVCTRCFGSGEIASWDGDPGHRSTYDRCDVCNGNGEVRA